MYINKHTTHPVATKDTPFSPYVFCYYMNKRRFCLARYLFEDDIWVDSDGAVINKPFVWSYLPINAMRTYIDEIKNKEM